jgi:hypothetical protein
MHNIVLAPLLGLAVLIFYKIVTSIALKRQNAGTWSTGRHLTLDPTDDPTQRVPVSSGASPLPPSQAVASSV